jgi:hypothetical protein
MMKTPPNDPSRSQSRKEELIAKLRQMPLQNRKELLLHLKERLESQSAESRDKPKDK